MPEICHRYAKDMPKIFPRYAQDMLKICPRYARHMAKIWPRYVQYMPKICLNYARDVLNLKICQRYTGDMRKICPKYCQIFVKSKNMNDSLTHSLSNMDPTVTKVSHSMHIENVTFLQLCLEGLPHPLPGGVDIFPSLPQVSVEQTTAEWKLLLL